jgi:hypothetical protein
MKKSGRLWFVQAIHIRLIYSEQSEKSCSHTKFNEN